MITFSFCFRYVENLFPPTRLGYQLSGNVLRTYQFLSENEKNSHAINGMLSSLTTIDYPNRATLTCRAWLLIVLSWNLLECDSGLSLSPPCVKLADTQAPVSPRTNLTTKDVLRPTNLVFCSIRVEFFPFSSMPHRHESQER